MVTWLVGPIGAQILVEQWLRLRLRCPNSPVACKSLYDAAAAAAVAAKHIANVTNMHSAAINSLTAVAGGSYQKYFTAP